MSHDLWWQLKTGEWILQHGFPAADPFSYATPGREWIELRWLFCVGSFLLYKTLGLNSLIAAKLVLVSLLLLVLGAAGRRGKAPWATQLGVLCAVALAHPRFLVRPELVTFLLLPTFLLLLQRFREAESSRWLWPLAALQVAWVNSHTLFILGPVVVGLHAVGEVADRWWLRPAPGAPPSRVPRLRLLAAACAATVAACLANPYGAAGAWFPFQLLGEIRGDHPLHTAIAEFRSPLRLAGWNGLFLVWVAVAAISAWVLARRRRQIPWAAWLLWLTFLYFSALAERNLALFGIVAGFLVIDHGRAWTGAAPWLRRAVPAAVATIAVAGTLLAASDLFFQTTDAAKSFGFGVSPHRFPARAMAWVRAQGLPGPLFHGLGDGGYLIFEGGPASVVVDGRLEVYGPERISQVARMTSTAVGFDEEARRLEVRTVLVRHRQDTGLLLHLERSAEWAPVYFDAVHVVYLRREPRTRELIQRLEIDWRHPTAPDSSPPAIAAARRWPGDWWPRFADPRSPRALGQLFVLVGNLAEARAAMVEVLRRHPWDDTAALYLGLLERAAGREQEARRLLATIGTRVLTRIDSHRLAGAIYEHAGRWELAIEAYEAATEVRPALEDLTGLARAALAAGQPELAESALRRVTASFPAEVDSWNNLAVLSYRRGSYQEAAQLLERSLAQRAAQPAVWNQLGLARLAVGDREGARSAWEKALAIAPDYGVAAGNLERLRTLPPTGSQTPGR